MQQILEKCYECNIERHVLFIDFKQAFDSVDRQKTIQILVLQELRIPNKLVRLIKITLQNMETSVKIENLTSKPFLISSGVCQGDPLSATVFNLILNSVIKKLSLIGDISLKLKQIVAYADDVVLLARSPKALKEIFHKLQNEATLVGLNINEDKTKYRVSHELRSLLRESVPYVKIYQYNPKHLCPKLNGYGDNGQRSLKL